MAPKSLQNLLKYVRSVLRDAGSHVADALQVPVHEPNIRALSAEEAERLRAWLLQQSTVLVSAGLLTLLGTGLRRGELLNLTADDWRRGQRQLHVSRSKGRKVRDVDVPDWLVPVLNTHGGVFDVSKDSLRRHLNNACERLDLPHIRVHDLRHTRITYLLLQGVPPLYVSQQAGHSSPSFTLSKYGHLMAASPTQRRGWCNA